MSSKVVIIGDTIVDIIDCLASLNNVSKDIRETISKPLVILGRCKYKTEI